ncbi:cupin domain-containing protein [uncultured Roseobacter sp.]|uniref:cupin domain-containing protein n=1 Tax=uncultured Roseobacter sp. TaxID=114847 RepID=UPI00345C6AFA
MICRTVVSLFLAAGFVATATAHEPVIWNNTTYQVRLSEEDSGGALGIFVAEMDGPGGPPMHVHEDADEAFFILEGRARFVVGGQETEVGPGDVAFAPAGAEHTFRMLSEEGGKQITVLTPGGFEGFFEAVVAEELKVPEDMARIGEIAADFQLRFTGPPLAP